MTRPLPLCFCSFFCREIDDIISADLEALMVRLLGMEAKGIGGGFLRLGCCTARDGYPTWVAGAQRLWGLPPLPSQVH